MPAPQVFEVSLDTPLRVSNGVPAAGAGNLETKASRDVYRFDVPAGGVGLYLDVLSPCPAWTRWRLTGPGGVVRDQFCYDGDRQLDLPAGAYTLEWYGERESWGAYSFETR